MTDGDSTRDDPQGRPPLPPETPPYPGFQAPPPAPASPPPAPPYPGYQAPPPPSSAPAAASAPVAPSAQQYPGYQPEQAPPPQYSAPQQFSVPQQFPGFQGAPPPGPPQRKKGLGTGAIIGIVGGGIAVLVALVVVVSLVVSQVAAGAGSRPDAKPDAKPAKPSTVVTDYLTALSKGDAKTALSYLSDPADDDTLLTDDVLAASNTIAPITAIKVVDEPTGSGSGDVTVSYLLGDTPVTTTYSVYDTGDDDGWKLSGGLGSLSVAQFDGLGLTVNGQAVDGDSVDVFPGSYELATTLPNFALTGETTLTVTEPYASADTSGIEPGLSDAGTAQFRSLVQAAVAACVASTTLAAGCGIDLPATLSDGTQLVEGTIQRTLDADTTTTLGSLEATLSYDNPTLAQGDYIGAVDVTAQCSQDGSTGTCNVLFGPSFGRPSVDLASATPTVLWD
jgi:hypothetical protein